MKISTKGRYALRMLIDLAEHQDLGFVSLKEIAARQSISKQYLEQIVALLNTSDILKANRGKHGGYRLAKPPSQIAVGQILRITEGNLAPVACLEEKINPCERSASCKTLAMWQGFQRVMTDYFDNITLEDISQVDQSRGTDEYVI